MRKRAKEARKAKVKVGVLEDTPKGAAKEVDKKTGKTSDLTVAEIAAVLHFGTKDGHIPPRPFLAMTFDAKREELVALGSDLLFGVLIGKLSLERALNVLGAVLANATKATVTAGVPPPNAPSTALGKAMKGRTKSLFAVKTRKTKETSAKRSTADLRGLGDAFAAIGATAAARGSDRGIGVALGIRKQGIRAARNLGDAFAQIGAIASVKPLIDTGRMLNAITWIIDKSKGKTG